MTNEEYAIFEEEIRKEIYDRLEIFGEVDTKDYEVNNDDDLFRLLVIDLVASDEVNKGLLDIEDTTDMVKKTAIDGNVLLYVRQKNKIKRKRVYMFTYKNKLKRRYQYVRIKRYFKSSKGGRHNSETIRGSNE